MNNSTNVEQSTGEETNGEPSEQQGERGYASYSGSNLSFDPMKDLNLPGSYDEVLARFKRLQGDRAMEVLN